MVINPDQELLELQEAVDDNESKIAVLEAAVENNPENVSELDELLLDIYQEIEQLQMDAIEAIEEAAGSVETTPAEEMA